MILNELKKKLNKNINKNRTNVTMADKLLVEAKKTNKNTSIPSMLYFTNLLKCLSKDRYENYQNWFNTGFCLFNIHHFVISCINAWSKQCSEKYDEKVVKLCGIILFYQKSESLKLKFKSIKKLC